MTIPFRTTMITVKRPASGADVDPYVTSDDTSETVVVSGLPAHISAPKGGANIIGGQQADMTFRLVCDPADIEHTDRIYDGKTSLTYELSWIVLREGLNLEHMEGDMRLVEGLSNG